MPPSYLDLFRCLALLRRLTVGPADLETLTEYVQMEADSDAYPPNEKGRKQFHHDIKRLRDWGVDVQHYEKAYHLHSYGDFSPVALREGELDTLAFLAETFGGDAPNSAAVQALLRRISDWLPLNQRGSIQARRRQLNLHLRRKDSDPIAPAVQEAIDRALSQRRLLRFAYRSPSRADQTPILHTVQVWDYLFDTQRGHYYLDAYCLRSEGPEGVFLNRGWIQYRPGRILAEGIEVLPDRLPPTPPKRARLALEYWLAPEIARHGSVTQHFSDTQMHERNGEGWVRVTATTDNLFMATRLLLGYGPYCKVTGGSEARREMEGLVRRMGEVYGV